MSRTVRAMNDNTVTLVCKNSVTYIGARHALIFSNFFIIARNL